MINASVSPAVALDAVSIHHAIDFPPAAARRFVARSESHGVENWKLREMIREIDATIPRMSYPTLNGRPHANNGRPHHWYTVGKEYSRVLYLNVVKGYLDNHPPYQFRPAFFFDGLTTTLEAIAKRYHADEFDVVENSDTMYKVRVWWD